MYSDSDHNALKSILSFQKSENSNENNAKIHYKLDHHSYSKLLCHEIDHDSALVPFQYP